MEVEKCVEYSGTSVFQSGRTQVEREENKVIVGQMLEGNVRDTD